MSELKELSWDIQQTVEPVPFEAIERSGKRRRRRRQALTGAGVVAAVTLAALAAVLPLGNVTGTAKPPAAGRTAIPVDQAAERLIHDKKSGAAAIAFGTPTRWASLWSSPQPGYTYSYAAVLSRDGVRATAPVRKNQYFVLRDGDEALALSMPTSMKATDPTWAQSVMVRLTDRGRIEKTLHWAPPTDRFTDDDVLLAAGTLRALNRETGTLREVKIPGADDAYEPFRDTTGRWWLVGAKNSGVRYVYWTDDHGKTWGRSGVGGGSMGGALGVSPNGRTMVLIPGRDPRVTQGDDPVPLRLSTDRGEHWTTVSARSAPYLSSPVAFDNGTGLALYQGKKRELLRPGAGAPFTPPTDLGELETVGDFVYGMQYNGNHVITSTDHGKTWKYFEPR